MLRRRAKGVERRAPHHRHDADRFPGALVLAARLPSGVGADQIKSSHPKQTEYDHSSVKSVGWVNGCEVLQGSRRSPPRKLQPYLQFEGHQMFQYRAPARDIVVIGHRRTISRTSTIDTKGFKSSP